MQRASCHLIKRKEVQNRKGGPNHNFKLKDIKIMFFMGGGRK